MGKGVLVTGASGFVGKRLLHELLRDGKLVYTLVRSREARDAIVKDVGMRDNLRFLRGDIKEELCGIQNIMLHRLGRDVDEVWHLAASTSFDASKTEEIEKINVGGTLKMLGLASLLPNLKEFVYMSTAYVCGTQGGVIPERVFDKVQGTFKNPYERTKFECEQRVKNAPLSCKKKIVRPSIIVGDSRTGETFGDDKVFYGYVRALYNAVLHAVGGKEAYRGHYDNAITPHQYLDVDARLPGSGAATKNVVCIDDVINVCRAVRGSDAEVFNVVNPATITMDDATAIIADALKVKGFSHDPLFIDRAHSRNKVERAAMRYTQAYWPYGSHVEPEWQDDNVQALGVQRVVMTPTLFSHLMRAYVERHIVPQCPD